MTWGKSKRSLTRCEWNILGIRLVWVQKATWAVFAKQSKEGAFPGRDNIIMEISFLAQRSVAWSCPGHLAQATSSISVCKRVTTVCSVFRSSLQLCQGSAVKLQGEEQ